MDTSFESKLTLEQQFFKESNQTPEAVKLVIAAFKKQHALSGLANILAKQEGYPVWDKSQVHINKPLQVSNLNGEGQNEETLVFTPIVPQDSNFCKWFLF